MTGNSITRRTALRVSLSAVPLLAALALAQAANALPGASGVSPLTGTPGIADASPELLALEREWWEAWVALRDAVDVTGAAQKRFFAEQDRLRPQFPEVPKRF